MTEKLDVSPSFMRIPNPQESRSDLNDLRENLLAWQFPFGRLDLQFGGPSWQKAHARSMVSRTTTTGCWAAVEMI